MKTNKVIKCNEVMESLFLSFLYKRFYFKYNMTLVTPLKKPCENAIKLGCIDSDLHPLQLQ
jgi:hypothetical protein